MKHGLVFAAALVLGIQAFADVVKLPSAIETKPHDLDSLLESGHVQGACCSGKGFFLSHQTGLDSFDWTGRHLKHIDVPAHLGDVAYANGRIYGVFCLRAEGRREYGAKGLIRVWNENLEEICQKPVADADLDGVAVLGDTLYVGVDRWGKSPHTDCCIRKYDLGLNLKDEKTLELGYRIVYGVQTMSTDGKDIFLGCYGGMSQISADLRILQTFRPQNGFKVSHGFDLVPEPVSGRPNVFFTVNALGGGVEGWRKDPANNPPRVQIRFFKYEDGRFVAQ